MADNEAYLGQGMASPVQVVDGRSALVSGREHIRECLRRLLSEPQGERFFQPDYGCRIKDLLFKPNTEVLKGLLRSVITDAVKQWEKRVRLKRVDFEFPKDEPNRINCVLQYEILPRNEVDSLVFPFYRGNPT